MEPYSGHTEKGVDRTRVTCKDMHRPAQFREMTAEVERISLDPRPTVGCHYVDQSRLHLQHYESIMAGKHYADVYRRQSEIGAYKLVDKFAAVSDDT